jgi:hypothetical protein
VLLTDSAGAARLGSQAAAVISLPKVAPEVAPILYTIPVQLLAYYMAVAKGTDVDQPRKSRQERDGRIAVAVGRPVHSCLLFLSRLHDRFPLSGPKAE